MLKHSRSVARSVLGILVSLLIFSAQASAESVRYYELEGFGSFLDGDAKSTAVTERGTIILPPVVRERFADPAMAFSAATAWGEDVVVATLEENEVLAIDRAGKTRSLFRSEDGVITALLGTDKTLYVAVAGPARIIRISKKGSVEKPIALEAEHIWDMEAGPKGVVYLATGAPGEVVELAGKKLTTLFKSEQTHMRSVHYNAGLGLFAGGGEKGVLFHRGKKGGFQALFDSNLEEVTAIESDESYAYAASVTGAQHVLNTEEGGKEGNIDVRSSVVKVAMDGTSEILAGSSDEAVFDLIMDDKKQLVVATGSASKKDPHGRLYSIEPGEHKIALIYQSPSRRLTHLIHLKRDAMAAVAGGGARIVHLTGGYAKSGIFLTPPFDAKINSRFGEIRIFAAMPKNTSVKAEMRTGQTSKPDESWSEFTKAVQAPGGKMLPAQNGRYMQLRLTLEGTGKTTPEVQRIEEAYLRQNLRPFVSEVVALRKGLALRALPPESDAHKSKTIPLTKRTGKEDKKATNGKKLKNGSLRAKQIPQFGALSIKWLADDPNGDSLRYDLAYRTYGVGKWITLATDLEYPFYTMQAAQFPDGYYEFQVKVTDAPCNPPGLERSHTGRSRAVLVDTTAPVIEPLKVEINGKRVTLRASVADSVGPLSVAEFTLDAGDFRPVHPDDAILDGAGETFTLRLGELKAGNHTLTFRTVDGASNEATASIRFKVK